LKTVRANSADKDLSAKITVLKTCHIFKGLTPGEIRELALLAASVHYAKGAYLFNDGDPAEFFYLAQEGLIKLHKESYSGKSVTFILASLGDTLNASALSIKRHFLSAQAITDATVLRIPQKAYWAFVSKHPSIAIEILSLTAQGLDKEYNRIVELIGEEVELRVVHSLFTLANKFGSNLMLKREELANYAGTTTETAIRVLSKLRKKGIISSAGRGAIAISSLANLQNYKR
jgi:CRP/FNR family transcriptional regulator, cyclic AMP receptor protein